MTASVQELHPARRLWARRALFWSTAAYVVLACGGLVFSLLSNIEVVLPNSRSTVIAHGLFFAGFMFPAVSVAALIVGWVLYSSDRYDAAVIAALVPWGYGSLVLALSLRHIL
ncbi:MAG: hypothetical protein AAF654_06315 [Myxococcota bacterium]